MQCPPPQKRESRKISIHHIKTLKFNKYLPFVFIYLPVNQHNSLRESTHSNPQLASGTVRLWSFKSGPRTEQGCRPRMEERAGETQFSLSGTGESEARDLSWP